jgi:hypothetical protein
MRLSVLPSNRVNEGFPMGHVSQKARRSLNLAGGNELMFSFSLIHGFIGLDHQLA